MSIEELTPVEITARMKDGLATFYGNKGAIEYFENAVKILNKKMIKSLGSNDVEIAKACAAKIAYIQEVLALAYQCYTNFEQRNAVKKG